MKVDEIILKKDLLQLLREMEPFDYYRGSKKLHLKSFSPKSAVFEEGQYANECNFLVTGVCEYVELDDSEGFRHLSPGGIQRCSVHIKTEGDKVYHGMRYRVDLLVYWKQFCDNETKSMMETDEKNAFLKEHGCSFYQSNDGKTQLCVVDSEQWKDAFVAILTEGIVCMRHTETNEFKGERTNRQVWSEIKHLKLYEDCQVSKIEVENANSRLKEYVFDYINNH